MLQSLLHPYCQEPLCFLVKLSNDDLKSIFAILLQSLADEWKENLVKVAANDSN